MENWPVVFMVITILIPLMVSASCFFSWKVTKSAMFIEDSFLFGSLGIGLLIYFIFIQTNSPLALISMLSWIWPLYTLDVLWKKKSNSDFVKIRTSIIMSGGVLSFILSGLGGSFFISAIPFSLAIFCIGFIQFYKSKELIFKIRSPLWKLCFIFISTYYANKLLFPFIQWNQSIFSSHVFLEVFSILGLSALGLAAQFENIKDDNIKEMEKILSERSNKLIGQSKFCELGMMSAGIAHEINNPLAIIMARVTQLLRVYHLTDRLGEVGEGLLQILNSTQRIDKTIKGIRELIYQDETAPVIEIKLSELFDNVLSFCGQRMKNHGVSIRLFGLEDVSVIGNKIQLEQVIINLFNNSFDAIEFLPDKWIEVSCSYKDDKIQLFFKDSGPGIPPEIASKIMEPFYSTKDIGKGTGLGLSLAKQMAQRHGGDLKYISHASHTTFLLELPKAVETWTLPLH